MQLSNKKLFYSKIIILVLIFVLGFIVRLYRFNGPIADWFSWRQADTSAVSRNFVTGGFDLLHPRFDDLSNVPSGIYDNPDGFRFVEFPIYNIFQAGLFITVGHFTIEEWGRLVTIFFSLLSALFLLFIVKRRDSFLSGVLTAFFFLFLPFNIFYGRTILPDPLMVTFILGSIYFFDLWVNSKRFSVFNFQFLIALVFSILAFLIKPFAAFFMLPMVYLAFEKFGFDFLKKWQLWIFAIISLLPFGLWRAWMLQYPAGIPQSSWLFNGNNIRFKGAFFNWIFARRIAEMILGFWGLPVLILGILAKYKKNSLFLLSFILSSLVYVSVVATGNVQHDYYQIPIIPSIAIFLGLGSAYLLNPPKEYISRLKTVPILIVCILFMFAFSWFEVRDFFNINNPSIVIAGQAVDSMTPKNAKVIALYGGDTSFLYQTKRKGWASFEKPLPELIGMGADYLVIANPKPDDYGLGKTYKVVSLTSDYILFNLREKP
ncbi:MAG: glycosyltransferase family 39 protein [Patescibacteria group bacterium]|nr:glycosyltransferase family 39 protein [Patescibacteria group bacterium]